jgi:ligand-binding SRPBCC domain-containing protein
MAQFKFTSRHEINKPLKDIFGFFSKAENLERLTPSWLNFKILTPLPIEMKTGTLIDYQITLYGIPLKWKTEITKWDPPTCFVDTQLKGPYSVWIHEHKFEEQNGKTIMTDTVDYDIPAGIFKTLVNKMFVSRQIHSIFEYRRKIINSYFEETDPNE